MAHDEELHDHDRGLSHDLPTLLSRRRALGLLGGTGLAVVLAGCGVTGNDDNGAGGSASASSAGAGTTSDGTAIPEETAGPYPGDGSNGVNVLTESGIVRSDITSSFGGPTGVATGVATTIALTLLNVDGDDVTPYEGAAIYLWHCDAQGRYSMYDQEISDENYLRGVQLADADGKVTFRSVFPAAYDGRWPHIHFEVYPSRKAAESASDKLRTSQIALPESAASKVYATDGYPGSTANLARTSLASDMVFADGYSLQMAKVTGNVDDGMKIALTVPI